VLEPKGETRSILFAMHGYRQLAEHFIRKFEPLRELGVKVIAPEGLHRFYIEGYSGRVGASWMTKEDRESDIKDYVAFLNLLGKEIMVNGPEVPIDLLGFSQGGPTACRWLAESKLDFRSLILHSTVFPNDFDFESQNERLKQIRSVALFGDDDQFAPERTIEEKTAWMASKGVDVELIRFTGKHDIHAESLIKWMQSLPA